MPGGRPKKELTLTDDERKTLAEWAKRPRTAQALALRARIVLACDEGADNVQVAKALGVTNPTVGKWRSRFVEKRLDGLADESRPVLRAIQISGAGRSKSPRTPRRRRSPGRVKLRKSN